MTQLSRKIRGFVVDLQTGTPVPNVVLLFEAKAIDNFEPRVEPRATDTRARVTDNNVPITFPLGMLVTDSAGYVSLDLTPYPGIPQTIQITPLGDEQSQVGVNAAFVNQPELRVHFVLKLDSNRVRNRANVIGLASIQNPDDIDREVSPHSFTVKNALSLGEGDCQTPIPAPFAVRDFRFGRVVLRTDQGLLADLPSAELDPTVDLGQWETNPLPLRFAEVLEFRQRWYPLGHSLGQIVYSVPLAPCESVSLAMIEWAREDTILREDRVRVREALFHDQRRDRTIEETVGAALKESQTGFSLMGGYSHADSAGASATVPIFGIPVNLNAAASNLWSLGGAIAHTSGSRDIIADSLQELHDRVRQATSVVRTLNSTVIIQATQQEQNVIQTRTITNHNHCHALTVQYYEVLRTFKVVTEFEKRRRVVLIPYRVLRFDRSRALRFRTILELVLLEPRLKPHFDALARLEIGDEAYKAVDAAPEPDGERTQPEHDYFSGRQTFKVNASEVKQTGLLIEAGSSVEAAATGEGIKFSFDLGPGYGPAGENRIAKKPFPAEGKHEYALLAQIGGEFYEIGAGASFTAQRGGSLRLLFNDWKLDDNVGSAQVEIAVTRPEPSPAPPLVPMPERPTTEAPSKRSDTVREQLLLSHLNGNIGYYNRAIWLLQDPTERRILLEALLFGTGLADLIDEMPVAVSGRYVAFPLDDPRLENVLLQPAIQEALSRLGLNQEILNDIWNRAVEIGPREPKKPEPLVSYVSLPTRGLFAEAQLGHCNSCEVRDVTRFWKWDESPCEKAPAIEGITPGPKGQPPAIPQPTSLPNPVVQVMQAPAAPDPVGLAAALKVLETPNIFRDMSGLDEVSKLLGQLTSGAVTSLQEAQKIAKEAQDKLAEEKKKASSVGGGGAPQQQTPEERFDNLRVARKAAEEAAALGMSPVDQQRVFENVLGTGPHPPAGQWAKIPSEDVREWYRAADLIRFRPPQTLVDGLSQRGLEWQRIEDASGDLLNLDRYTLVVGRLPNDPATGTQFTAGNFFDYIRKHFPSLLIEYPGLPGPSLEAYEPDDNNKWLSNSPLGAVMKFRIDPRPFAEVYPPFPLSWLTVPEFGLVMCAEYVTDQAAGDWHWNFVTVKGTGVVGYHPISGTRQFGLQQKGQSLIFYIRAADRATTFIEAELSGLVFSAAEAYWNGFFANLLAFIKSNGGDATIWPPYSKRHDWETVRRHLFSGSTTI